jgi:hypothetical protein
MNKYILETYTDWSGMESRYAAYAEDESDLWEIADTLAYDNFIEKGGPEHLLMDLFPNLEVGQIGELSEEQEAKYYEAELCCYGCTIHLVETKEQEEEFKLLELVT